jgi:NAD(P)-dependent dehydrogenase (short-subunit alcohol dehydrogenase family)
MLCCRKALKHLADGASIVFISSIAGLRSGSRLIAYDTSKAALGGLMRNVAKEGARRGIRANIICPGLVDTPLGRHTSAGRPSRSAAGVPFGRMATGWEIAYAALFFMSEESVYVNAQTLAVDSGITGLWAKIRGEDLPRRRVDHGNKATAGRCPDDACIAIFADISTS